jgi:hypothetical protein
MDSRNEEIRTGAPRVICAGVRLITASLFLVADIAENTSLPSYATMRANGATPASAQ